MAHEIHTLIDADGAPTDAQTKYDNWYANHNFVLTDREQGYTENPPRDDGTLQGYHEFRVYLSLQDDLQTAISNLEAQFPDASWMVVHTRRNDAELEEDPLQSDATYYDPDLTDGLRSDVSPVFDGHTVEHNDIHYVSGGTEYTVSAGSYEFDEPKGVYETTLYAYSSGELTETSGVKVADVEVHPGRIVNIQQATQPTTFDESWTTQVTRGTPPNYFADKTVALPDTMPSDYFDRNTVTNSEQQKIYDLIDQHSNPETSQLAKQIVDVVFDNN